MKCPFRKDDKGEFKDCYEKSCMAYCEAPDYNYTTATSTVTPVCKMMGVALYPVNCGGCN